VFIIVVPRIENNCKIAMSPEDHVNKPCMGEDSGEGARDQDTGTVLENSTLPLTMEPNHENSSPHPPAELLDEVIHPPRLSDDQSSTIAKQLCRDSNITDSTQVASIDRNMVRATTVDDEPSEPLSPTMLSTALDNVTEPLPKDIAENHVHPINPELATPPETDDDPPPLPNEGPPLTPPPGDTLEEACQSDDDIFESNNTILSLLEDHDEQPKRLSSQSRPSFDSSQGVPNHVTYSHPHDAPFLPSNNTPSQAELTEDDYAIPVIESHDNIIPEPPDDFNAESVSSNNDFVANRPLSLVFDGATRTLRHIPSSSRLTRQPEDDFEGEPSSPTLRSSYPNSTEDDQKRASVIALILAQGDEPSLVQTETLHSQLQVDASLSIPDDFVDHSELKTTVQPPDSFDGDFEWTNNLADGSLRETLSRDQSDGLAPLSDIEMFDKIMGIDRAAGDLSVLQLPHEVAKDSQSTSDDSDLIKCDKDKGSALVIAGDIAAAPHLRSDSFSIASEDGFIEVYSNDGVVALNPNTNPFGDVSEPLSASFLPPIPVVDENIVRQSNTNISTEEEIDILALSQELERALAEAQQNDSAHSVQAIAEHCSARPSADYGFPDDIEYGFPDLGTALQPKAEFQSTTTGFNGEIDRRTVLSTISEEASDLVLGADSLPPCHGQSSIQQAFETTDGTIGSETNEAVTLRPRSVLSNNADRFSSAFEPEDSLWSIQVATHDNPATQKDSSNPQLAENSFPNSEIMLPSLTSDLISSLISSDPFAPQLPSSSGIQSQPVHQQPHTQQSTIVQPWVRQRQRKRTTSTNPFEDDPIGTSASTTPTPLSPTANSLDKTLSPQHRANAFETSFEDSFGVKVKPSTPLAVIESPRQSSENQQAPAAPTSIQPSKSSPGSRTSMTVSESKPRTSLGYHALSQSDAKQAELQKLQELELLRQFQVEQQYKQSNEATPTQGSAPRQH
jgi:hypothetical protein